MALHKRNGIRYSMYKIVCIWDEREIKRVEEKAKEKSQKIREEKEYGTRGAGGSEKERERGCEDILVSFRSRDTEATTHTVATRNIIMDSN